MLVEELIAELQKYDPKLLVITRGYEGGFEEIENTLHSKIALNVNEAWYYGPHESADDYKVTEKHTIVDAVFIG